MTPSRLPKISIITPSFNQGEYIEATIRSVLDQGYPHLEYIVVDGGSSDGTVDILKRYEDRLTWSSEADRGQSHALNKGISKASGDIIAFLNSDDLYEDGALVKVGGFFASNAEVYWLTGKCRTIDLSGKEIRKAITLYKNFWLWVRSYRVLLVLDYVSQPATFWRREVVEKVGPFDESLNFSMDYDYSLRVGKSYKLWVLPDYLASFRIHGQSKSGQIVAHFNTDLRIAKKHTASRSLIGLHTLHNAMIIKIYQLLSRRQGIMVC